MDLSKLCVEQRFDILSRESMHAPIFPVQALTFLLTFLAATTRADDASTKGQEIFEKNQRAVVTVEMVTKTSYSKDGQTSAPTDSKYELTGTVVDPSGLTVLALSGCEPAEFYRRVMPEYAAYKAESQINNVKILLNDGNEMPAEIVLRDKDLDLAFIRPKTPPATPMPAVDLTKATSAKVLEQIITLNRLNNASGRTYSAAGERILAVIRKPRTFYVHDPSNTGTALGSPAFALDGNILGVVVMRTGSSPGSNYRENAASVIVPAEDILKASKQVPPFQNGAEKKAEGKDAKNQP